MPLKPENLPDQTLSVDEITPFHEQIVARYATLNIGTIGHVAHGKSSLCRALTGVNTVKFSSEKEHNITIKLGYANCKIFSCPRCPEPYNCYSFGSSETNPRCKKCKTPLRLERHISITDCPGHDEYMTTMLSGAAIMDGTILLIAGNEDCPQPQTTEHLQAIAIYGRKQCIVCQNKIDLLNSQADAIRNQQQIVQFIRKFDFMSGAYIVPTSAVRGLNVNIIAYHLSKMAIPDRRLSEKPLFTVIRSFDVNKTGMTPEELTGGVVGGTLSRGVLTLGDVVEIRPGIVEKDGETVKCYPLRTKIVNMKTEDNELRYAIPGGLIAVGTLLDPSITRSDRMIGQVMGFPGHMPNIYRTIYFDFHLLDNLAYIAATGFLEPGSVILLTVVGCNSSATVNTAHENRYTVTFIEKPVCVEFGAQIAISVKNARMQSKNWRLLGYGVVCGGDELQIGLLK